MSHLSITAHAILRYAERVMGFPIDHARQTLERRFGVKVSETTLLEHLEDNGMLDAQSIREVLDTPMARIAADMVDAGECNVVTRQGRIVIKNRTVVTFLEREMKRTNRPQKYHNKVWIRGQRRVADV